MQNYYEEPFSADPESLTVFNGTLYFFAIDGRRDRGLYKLVEGPAPVLGDTNFDGLVDLADLNNVRNHFGEMGNVLGDADGNGVVDLADLNAVRNNFGAGAPSPAPPRATSRNALPVRSVDASRIVATGMTKPKGGDGQDVLFRVVEDGAFSDGASTWTLTGSAARRLKAIDRVFAMI